MKDYRIHRQTQLRELLQEMGSIHAVNVTHVRDKPPRDRKGLIAVVHPLVIDPVAARTHVGRTVEQSMEQILAAAKPVPLLVIAGQVAKETSQRVYYVMTETRWHLLLFADNSGGYDGEENGKFANDQYIAYFDPDGSSVTVGIS